VARSAQPPAQRRFRCAELDYDLRCRPTGATHQVLVCSSRKRRALPPGASGTVIDVGDKEIVVRFPCLAEREEVVTFDADCAADYMETDCTSCIYFAPDDHCCLDPQRGRAGA
jgi:hypothetical protein